MTVPFPNGALEVFVEAAFGADIDGDPSTWVWTDLTPEADSQLIAQTITTTRGRQDESSDVTATQAEMQLDNPNGDLTPDNAASIYYPNVDLGTPARWGIENTHPRLLIRPFPSSRAQVNSTAALDLASDLDVRIDLHTKTTDPQTSRIVVAGRASDVGDYSWRVQFAPDRRVTVRWSPDGTPGAALELTSSVPVLPMSARTVLRVTVDVDNGAGGHDARFYLGQSMSGPWMQVGATQTGAGATTVFNAPADLVVGCAPDVGTTGTSDADVYAFRLLNGIDGAALADADFTAQTSGATSFVDTAGRTWNILASAELTNRWLRILGTVDEWAPKWPWGDLSSQQEGGLGEGEARVEIAINGILRRLGQGAAPLPSALRRSIEGASGVVAYWPMEDGKESTQIASAFSDGAAIVPGGGIAFADDDSLVGSKALPKLTGTTFFSGPVSAVFTTEWQVDWYANILLDSIAAGTWSIMRVTGSGTVRTWEVRVNSTLIAVVGLNAAGGVVTTSSTALTNFFDRWVHIRLDARQSGGNVVWQLHWVPVTYPASTPMLLSSSFVGAVGGVTAVGITPGDGLNDAHMGHLAVYAALVDTGEGAAMGWQGETAMTRITRLCAEQLIDLRVIGVNGETALMGPQRVATLLELLSDAEDADGGILYEQACSVGLVYRARSSLYNQPANVILSGLQGQLQNPLEPIRDDQKIRNFVTVTRDGGSSSPAADQASITKHGLYQESVTLNLLLDSQTLDAAAWRVHQGTVEGMRYPQLTTNLGVAPEIIDPWLTVDVGARIDAIDLPPQHPADVRVMVEGYSEPISPTTWTPTANCSPASVWDVAELDGDWVSDEYLLRLETDGSRLDAPVTSTATALDVEVFGGPFWVTDPAEFPIDLSLNGEHVRATAISAAVGNVQTFTVVRSLNNVVRSHSAGAPVELWFQPVLAR